MVGALDPSTPFLVCLFSLGSWRVVSVFFPEGRNILGATIAALYCYVSHGWQGWKIVEVYDFIL